VIIMTTLIFIRHAPTRIDKNIASKNWTLTEDGQRLCKILAQKIQHYPISQIYASSEKKAQLTGQYIAEALQLESPIIKPNLQETESSNFYESQTEFRAKVKIAMQHPQELHFGDETFYDAKSRFSAQVENLAQQHRGETIAIVTHGRILSMYLAEIMKEAPEIIWERLQMPAFALLSWEEKTILEIYYSVEIA